MNPMTRKSNSKSYFYETGCDDRGIRMLSLAIRNQTNSSCRILISLKCIQNNNDRELLSFAFTVVNLFIILTSVWQNSTVFCQRYFEYTLGEDTNYLINLQAQKMRFRPTHFKYSS